MLLTAPTLGPGTAREHTTPDSLRLLDITIFYAEASGGVRTYLDAKAHALSHLGVSHALVIPGGEDAISTQGGTRVYRLRSPAIPTTPGYRLLTSAQALERIIQEERPDLIELGSPFLVPLLVRWATRGGRRPPVVGFYHSDLVRTYAIPCFRRLGRRGEGLGVAAAQRYIRSVYGGCDATVAASPTVAEELRGMGVPRVHHIPLGVDLALFRPERRSGGLRERVGIPPGKPMGIFVGRMCEEKRLDVVLKAHSRLPATQRPHLVLVGTGQLRDSLEGMASTHPHLTVLPWEHDRERLAGLMADADFYLASGPGETFGLAVAEAMACGLGVLGVASGAVPDRVSGSTVGYLYQNGDVEECALRMEQVTREVGPSMRLRARAHATENFGWDRTFRLLLDLYGSLTGRPTPTPQPTRSALPPPPPPE